MTRRTLLFALGLAMTAAYLFPLYWMYVSAFKDGSEIYRYPPTLWPQDPVWNLSRVFTETPIVRYLFNSFVIALGSTIAVVAFGTGCAYAFSRLRGWGVGVCLFLVLCMQVLPSSLLVTPLFVGFNQVGLLDYPRFAVVLAQAAKMLPLYIVLCRTAFLQVPRELEDAAFVDGATKWQILTRIALPLARNGVLVAGMLVFLQSFGEYVYARSLISDGNLQTATVGLQTYMGPNANDWSAIMTFAAIYVTPILLVFMLLQRRIVSGLTAGALK